MIQRKNTVIKMCNKCYELNCNCKNNIQIEIDKNIYPIIKILNQKGYKTKYCCEGHIEHAIFDLYILFEESYNFQSLPKEIKINKKGDRLYQNDSQTHYPNTEYRKKLKNETLEALLKWSIALKNNKE